MKNLYKSTNFSDAEPLPIDDSFLVPVTVSDSIYDAHVNISHAFVPEKRSDGSFRKRLIGDIELCLSTSASVRSVVSPDYQRNLRDGLLNQPRAGSQTQSLSDDDIASHVIPYGLEHDEAAVLIKAGLDSILPSVESPQPDVAPPSESPAPVS